MTTMAEMDRKIDSLQKQITELLKHLEALESRPKWEIHHHEHRGTPVTNSIRPYYVPSPTVTPRTPYLWETICGKQW